MRTSRSGSIRSTAARAKAATSPSVILTETLHQGRQGQHNVARRRAERAILPNVHSVAERRFWRHNGAMPSVQIKDVPDGTHAVLRRRAAAAHQSLQEYLRARLIEDASQPTLDEVLDRAGGRSGGNVPLKTAVAAIRDDRDRR
jgi:antitoxin FitA